MSIPARSRQASIAAEPGIARGGADDGDPLLALGQEMLVKPAQKLQGHVLEGQSRPVEQLHQPEPGVDLAERRHRLVAEAGIGLGHDPGKIRLADPAAQEWRS